MQKYRVKIKIIASYHLIINDIIKQDYQFIVDVLSNLTNNKFKM